LCFWLLKTFKTNKNYLKTLYKFLSSVMHKWVLTVETKSYFDVLKITNSINYISIQFWSSYNLTSVFKCFYKTDLLAKIYSLIFKKDYS
jgi:hypothetical protein